MFGTFPQRENFSSLETVSSFPTMSENVLGRYFSILKAHKKTTERQTWMASEHKIMLDGQVLGIFSRTTASSNRSWPPPPPPEKWMVRCRRRRRILPRAERKKCSVLGCRRRPSLPFFLVTPAGKIVGDTKKKHTHGKPFRSRPSTAAARATGIADHGFGARDTDGQKRRDEDITWRRVVGTSHRRSRCARDVGTDWNIILRRTDISRWSLVAIITRRYCCFARKSGKDSPYQTVSRPDLGYFFVRDNGVVVCGVHCRALDRSCPLAGLRLSFSDVVANVFFRSPTRSGVRPGDQFAWIHRPLFSLTKSDDSFYRTLKMELSPEELLRRRDTLKQFESYIADARTTLNGFVEKLGWKLAETPTKVTIQDYSVTISDQGFI